ncbi:hypothetical protein Emin_0873 [Elusimicrobium minutum Pei191]|uniref:Uncharacterized protein n=2 Tax=Elusimicrobium TaxID=423604 RepID=B2KD32_ELUMP|nr:hypothetical protein Emin_0873 [Elusimicrobium minutum Pei191]
MKRLAIPLILLLSSTASFSLSFSWSKCFAISPLSVVNSQDIDIGKTYIRFCMNEECEEYVDRHIISSDADGVHCMDEYDKHPYIVFDEGYDPKKQPPEDYLYPKFILVFKNGQIYETGKIEEDVFRPLYKFIIHKDGINIITFSPADEYCEEGACTGKEKLSFWKDIECDKTKKCIKERIHNEKKRKKEAARAEKDYAEYQKKDQLYDFKCDEFLEDDKCPVLWTDNRYLVANNFMLLSEKNSSAPYNMAFSKKCNKKNYNSKDDYCIAWMYEIFFRGKFPKECDTRMKKNKETKERIFNTLIKKFQYCHIKEEERKASYTDTYSF